MFLFIFLYIKYTIVDFDMISSNTKHVFLVLFLICTIVNAIISLSTTVMATIEENNDNKSMIGNRMRPMLYSIN